ncbi:Coq4 family protein [Aerosakkonemataceae cyanobacterium BLCC-F50]|uniref:Coq4 family protein n=1 Tax=Floridaenema flaviceps BLCC-F50 TaxID=3153642 RepID=A0ABV4XZ57_9CYAN
MKSMLNPGNAQNNSTSRIQQFFDFLDRTSELTGRNVPQIVHIEELRVLPSGTFGRAVADFLDQNHLTPFSTGSRRKQLHDTIHVLTGYGSDPVGEAEVQAFLLGNKFNLFNLTIGLGLLRLIHKQLLLNQTTVANFSWERLWRAYQRGSHVRLDPDTWQPEHLWELPLHKVQAFIGIS